MIINTKLGVINHVHRATLEIELDAQESRFVKAYGEPRVDIAGVFPYEAQDPPAPEALLFDIEEDIGSSVVGGSTLFNTASHNWEITAAGSIAAGLSGVHGFHKGVRDVLADIRFETQIDYVDAELEVATADYIHGWAILPGFDASANLPGVFFGWGSYDGQRGIWAFEKEANEDGTLIGSLVPVQYANGVFLRIERTGSTFILKYSLNNAETWSVFAEVHVAAKAPRIGLFTSSGDTNNTATSKALFSRIATTTNPPAIPGTFEILGSPSMRYIRSQSPLSFQLDGKVDPEAEQKVVGWAIEMKARLEHAKVTLLGHPDPGMNPTASMRQV